MFDNVQAYAKQWEMRIGCENVMRVRMAGTAVGLTAFNQQAVDLGKWHQLISEGRPRKMQLKMDDLLNLPNKAHNWTVGILHWLQVLTTYVLQLKSYKTFIWVMFHMEPSANMWLDKNGVHRTVVYPLTTSAKNKTSSMDLRHGLIDFLEQIGQTLDDHHHCIILVGGDSLTFEQLKNLK